MMELPLPEKRRPLTRRQFAELILKQDGRCGCGCNRKLVADRIIDEHLNPLDSMGSNLLSNRALYDRDCAAAKTAQDKKASAKGARLRKETCNGPSRPIPQPKISALSSKHPRYVKRKIGQ